MMYPIGTVLRHFVTDARKAGLAFVLALVFAIPAGSDVRAASLSFSGQVPERVNGIAQREVTRIVTFTDAAIIPVGEGFFAFTLIEEGGSAVHDYLTVVLPRGGNALIVQLKQKIRQTFSLCSVDDLCRIIEVTRID